MRRVVALLDFVAVAAFLDRDDLLHQTVSHAGAVLLVERADRLALTAALSEGLAGQRQRHAGHDRGTRSA